MPARQKTSPSPGAIAIHCHYDRLADPASLRFNPANDNKHPDEQLHRIVAVFQEIGIRHPVIVSSRSGMVVVGEGRARATILIPGANVPVVEQDFASEAEELAFLLADNKISDLSERDDIATATLIEKIKASQSAFTLQATGYADREIKRLLASLTQSRSAAAATNNDADPQFDRAAALQKKWNVHPGSIFTVGAHRILCGDSTKAEDVAALMAGNLADIVFTSPPYDQQREYRDAAREKVLDWNELMTGVFANLPAAEKCQVLVNLGLVHREGEWIPYWEKWIEWMRGASWQRFGW